MKRGESLGADPKRAQHRVVVVHMCQTAGGGGRQPSLPCTRREHSTTHPAVPPQLCELRTHPRACLHRKCLITISFISSAAGAKGEALLCVFLFPAAPWDLAVADPSLFPFFIRGSLPEIHVHSRKGRLAHRLLLACSSNDLG